VLGKIGRILFHIDHCSSLFERIVGIRLWAVKRNTFILEELAGELVTINNSKDSSVDIDVETEVEISPGVVNSCIFGPSDFVAFQKDTLRDSTILYSLLNDMHGIILKIVKDGALSNSVIFIGIFDNWLLEISVELKDLY
jgi:hypothetical protein